MNRQEIKFINEKINKINLISRLKINEIYHPRIINSIYFDTSDLRFFNLSEEGITPRYKVRIRFYNNQKKINFEMKITENYFRKKIVYKKSIFKENFFNEFLNNNKINFKLFPKLLVTYNRTYFQSKYGRITFDTEIKYHQVNQKMQKVGKYFSDPTKVIEVKYNTKKYDKNEIINYIGLSETRNSKYCNGINMIYQKKYNFVS